MRHASHPAFIASLLVLLFMQHATAQVYQCLDTNGKKVFSQIPCAAQGGDGEKRIMRAPAGGTPAAGKPGALYGNSAAAAEPRDWGAENAAANARAAAAEASSGSRQGAPSAPGGLRKGNTPPSASDKQIIANCEANHGARCGSAGEIAQRRMEQRELTPAERQQQQNAVAARRYREQEEAFNRSSRR